MLQLPDPGPLVYPGATISGSARLDEQVTVGTGANVLPGVNIGAGAVVVDDVAPRSTVVGVPARPTERGR